MLLEKTLLAGSMLAVIFALPLGVLGAFAARQAKRGNINRFRTGRFAVRNLLIKLAIIFGALILTDAYNGHLQPAMANIAIALVLPLPLIAASLGIGWATYRLFFRRTEKPGKRG